jgi:hypothetical protein
MSALETRLTVIETRLDTWKPADKIPDLAENIGELKNWRCFFPSLRMARRPWVAPKKPTYSSSKSPSSSS